MKSILKTGIVTLVLLFSIQGLHAQDFPATEAEAKELISKKWTAKFLIMGENKLEASSMNLNMVLVVNKDMTYSMTFMTESIKGKWSIDITKKMITLYDEENKPETLIKMLKKDEMSAEPADEEDAQGMKMILVPSTE